MLGAMLTSVDVCGGLYIVEKALDELESVPTEKREGLKHLDQEINDAVEKLKILKEKLKAAENK